MATYQRIRSYFGQLMLLATLGLLSACTSHLTMSDEVYSQINLGMSKEEIARLAGEPFDVRPSEEGSGLELVYIDRREYERGYPTHMHYIFQIDQEGNVFDKKRRFLEQDPLEIEWRID